MSKLMNVVDMTKIRPLVNGRPLPEGVTMDDWMRLTRGRDFYAWKNMVRGIGFDGPWRVWSGI